MHTAVLCVASNTDAWQSTIDDFRAKVQARIDTSAEFSAVYSTLSTTDGITPYHNMVGRICCEPGIEELNALMKQWEREAGRVAGSKSVPLDVDIVLFDGEVIRQRDYAQEYFQTGYRALDQGRSRRDI